MLDWAETKTVLCGTKWSEEERTFYLRSCPERTGRSARHGDAAEPAASAPQSLTAAPLLVGAAEWFLRNGDRCFGSGAVLARRHQRECLVRWVSKNRNEDTKETWR